MHSLMKVEIKCQGLNKEEKKLSLFVSIPNHYRFPVNKPIVQSNLLPIRIKMSVNVWHLSRNIFSKPVRFSFLFRLRTESSKTKNFSQKSKTFKNIFPGLNKDLLCRVDQTWWRKETTAGELDCLRQDQSLWRFTSWKMKMSKRKRIRFKLKRSWRTKSNSFDRKSFKRGFATAIKMYIVSKRPCRFLKNPFRFRIK